jgi:actin-like ATPase involved in cell morphogenesis
MIANRLISFLADPDVAIDLGTANTRIYVPDRGVVADQPTRVPPDAAAPRATELAVGELPRPGWSR